MSRVQYSDEEEWPGQWALWAANNQRALNSRRGQATLAEVEAALVALPEKRLVRGVLGDAEGVCLLGALIAVKAPELLKPDPARDLCDCDHERVMHKDDDGMLACRSGWRDGSRLPWGCDCAEFHLLIGPREPWEDEYEERDRTMDAAAKVGVPERVAFVLMELNDEKLEAMTPEERYERALAWVRKELADPTPPARKAAEFAGLW